MAGDGIGHILTHLPLMQQKFSLRCYDKSFRLFRACACVKNAYFRQLCQNVAQFYYKRVYIFFKVYTGFLLRSRVSVLMMVVGRSDSEDLRLRSRPKPRVKEQNGDNKEQTNQGGTQGVDDK